MIRALYRCEYQHHLPFTPIVIFEELVYPLDHNVMPRKFCDNISNSSGAIMLAYRQANKYTNRHTENNITLTAREVMTS